MIEKGVFVTLLGKYTKHKVVDSEGTGTYLFCNTAPNEGYGFVLIQNCFTGMYKFIKAMDVKELMKII